MLLSSKGGFRSSRYVVQGSVLAAMGLLCMLPSVPVKPAAVYFIWPVQKLPEVEYSNLPSRNLACSAILVSLCWFISFSFSWCVYLCERRVLDRYYFDVQLKFPVFCKG